MISPYCWYNVIADRPRALPTGAQLSYRYLYLNKCVFYSFTCCIFRSTGSCCNLSLVVLRYRTAGHQAALICQYPTVYDVKSTSQVVGQPHGRSSPSPNFFPPPTSRAIALRTVTAGGGTSERRAAVVTGPPAGSPGNALTAERARERVPVVDLLHSGSISLEYLSLQDPDKRNAAV